MQQSAANRVARICTGAGGNGGSVTRWVDYLSAGGERVAQRTITVGGSTVVNYFVADHLGSISVVMDGTGAVVSGGRLTYDPWGKPTAATTLTTRGFTDHEMIPPGPGVSLINMNARVYDPELARFMSADSIVPDLFDAQTLNRYTYVNNRPLSLTDPTGNFGVAEIVITGFKFTSFLGPVTTVVSVIVSIFKAIFGGLFGGAKKAALLHITSSPALTPPPNYVAGAGGTPTGMPPPVAEAKTISGGVVEIKIVGTKITSTTLNSAVSVETLIEGGVPTIVIEGIRPPQQGFRPGPITIPKTYPTRPGPPSPGSPTQPQGAPQGDEFDKSKLPEFDYNDPTKPPVSPDGTKWEWHGEGPPGTNPRGAWVNPKTGETLHPDMWHAAPRGPHWTYCPSVGRCVDIFPDGRIVYNGAETAFGFGDGVGRKGSGDG